MTTDPKQIVDEILQLKTQYRREVPGGRRAWPESIKSRVVKLSTLGLTPKQIAQQTEFSYYTIVGWIPADQRRRYRTRRVIGQDPGKFAPVRVREDRAIATVTVAKPEAREVRASRETATVTVTLPGGIRIDGVTPEFLTAWIGRAAGGGS